MAKYTLKQPISQFPRTNKRFVVKFSAANETVRRSTVTTETVSFETELARVASESGGNLQVFFTKFLGILKERKRPIRVIYGENRLYMGYRVGYLNGSIPIFPENSGLLDQPGATTDALVNILVAVLEHGHGEEVEGLKIDL